MKLKLENVDKISDKLYKGRGKEFTFRVPVVDVMDILSSLGKKHLPWSDRQTIGPQRGIPLVMFVSKDGLARYSIGTIEQGYEFTVEVRLDEAAAEYVVKFEYRDPTEVTFYVSDEPADWQTVVDDYRKHVQVTPMRAPAAAYEPTFCSWYGIHHQVNQKWSLDAMKLMHELGVNTYIIDDGWFFPEKGEWGSYVKTGDWQVAHEKFHDLKAMVADMHAMGCRVLLWIAPFMVGRESDTYKSMAKYLRGPEDRQVRWLTTNDEHALNHVVDTCARLINDYGMDGLKLDFIDSLPYGEANGLGTFYERLKSMFPDKIFELRQMYANIFASQYGMIFRGIDTPLDYWSNLSNMILLRTFTPEPPLHMDYLYWHYDEHEVNVARHMMVSMFFIPTFSFDPMKLKPAHKAIIRKWLDFYNEHRDTLLNKGFRVQKLNIVVGDQSKQIVGYFQPDIVEVEGAEIYVLNGSESDTVILKREGKHELHRVPIGEYKVVR